MRDGIKEDAYFLLLIRGRPKIRGILFEWKWTDDSLLLHNKVMNPSMFTKEFESMLILLIFAEFNYFIGTESSILLVFKSSTRRSGNPHFLKLYICIRLLFQAHIYCKLGARSWVSCSRLWTAFPPKLSTFKLGNILWLSTCMVFGTRCQDKYKDSIKTYLDSFGNYLY